MSFTRKLKSNRIIYAIGHKLNLFCLKFHPIIISFRYIFADRIKLVVNNKKSKTKYLIFQKIDFTGLMTHMLTVLGWLKYAEEKGYTLVVDMSKGENQYKDVNENTWEKYYLQPMMQGVSIDENEVNRILKNENFSICPSYTRYGYSFDRYLPRKMLKLFPPVITFPTTHDYTADEKTQAYYEQLYNKYIKMQPSVIEYVESEYNELLKNEGKVLGVLIRGSAYRDGKPFNHNIQPEIEDVIAKIDEYKELYNWDKIYFASEESKYEELLNERYPNKIIVNKRHYKDNSIADTKYQAGLEYLSSMYLLSRCQLLVAGLCGGSQAAILMNQHNFEHAYVFDIGYYQ
ncbi:MAG: hypothetical protein MJ076_04710 [Clostridia bacterium]|nr:hypothetical protein [Clostridia bacterium]